MNDSGRRSAGGDRRGQGGAAQPGCLDAAVAYYRAQGPTLPAALRRKVQVPAVCFAGTDDLFKPELLAALSARPRSPSE